MVAKVLGNINWIEDPDGCKKLRELTLTSNSRNINWFVPTGVKSYGSLIGKACTNIGPIRLQRAELSKTEPTQQLSYSVRKSPREGFWLYLVTPGSYRYQDRWKWFLPVSRSSLNPPGAWGKKSNNLSYRTRHVRKSKEHIIIFRSLLIPFKGPIRGFFPSTVLQVLHVFS